VPICVIEPGVRAAVADAPAPHRSSHPGNDSLGAYGRRFSPRCRLRSSFRSLPAVRPAGGGWTDTPVTRLVAKEYLHAYEGANIDALVLGCTHCPLLKPVIRGVLGRRDAGRSAVETALKCARVRRADRAARPGEFARAGDTSPTL
jgi:glutamate racemase